MSTTGKTWQIVEHGIPFFVSTSRAKARHDPLSVVSSVQMGELYRVCRSSPRAPNEAIVAAVRSLRTPCAGLVLFVLLHVTQRAKDLLGRFGAFDWARLHALHDELTQLAIEARTFFEDIGRLLRIVG